jgi:ATP-dependent Lhr-like helicase
LHYSSLDQEYRQGVEGRFREEPQAVCVATSTLELGVDIGDVDAVAMWGAPHTVTGFIQRLGRGNRRTGVGLVYGACPRVKELGACEPEDDLLRFASLVYCAGKNELETPHLPEFYTVLVQQLLAIALRYDRVAPDALTRLVGRVPDFVVEPVLRAVLDGLAAAGLLEHEGRLDLWLATDRLRLRPPEFVWGNLGGPEQTLVVGQAPEEPIPLVQVPRQYARSLAPGRVVLFAGKPRLVTRVKGDCVWVSDLKAGQAELARYLAAPQPTPAAVAAGIRQVLTMPDEELAGLPVSYDEWATQTLKLWRERLGRHLGEGNVTAEREAGGGSITPLGASAVNWLLTHWTEAAAGVRPEADAWRLKCPEPVDFRPLRGCGEATLWGLLEAHWDSFVERLGMPPLFRYLPPDLQRLEVGSVLELGRVTAVLRDLAAGIRPA